MRDVVTTADVRELSEINHRYCISWYLTTHAAGRDVEQGPIRFKNLIGRARDEMLTLGVSARHVSHVLDVALPLLGDQHFWDHQATALAVFTDGRDLWRFRVESPIEQLTVVAERFHLAPLIAAAATDDVFYVLALSRNQIRLARATRFTSVDATDDRIVPSLEAALHRDDREPQLQSHASSRAGTGSVVPTFHGQGASKDTSLADLQRFLKMVDHGVESVIGDAYTPLVLAGVDDITAEYAKLSRHRAIVGTRLAGNPERRAVAELHDRARPLVEPLLDGARRRAQVEISERSTPTHTALTDVVLAAQDGRVATLFVAHGAHRWGTFDQARRTTATHDERAPGDCDLLDAAAIETIRHRGQVFVVPPGDVPLGGDVVAALRG